MKSKESSSEGSAAFSANAVCILTLVMQFFAGERQCPCSSAAVAMLGAQACRGHRQGKIDMTLVLKMDFFSMLRFHKQRGNSSLVGKKMLLEVPEGGFIRGSNPHIFM